MFQPIDFVPDYIRCRYPTYQAFQQALYSGDIVRDNMGNLRLKEEFQPQPYYGQYPLYMAKPVIDEQNMIEFDMFNIEGVRGYYKIDENGNKIRLVNAEDIARGAGLVRIRKDRVHTSVDSPEYIHWDRVNQYAQSRIPYLQQAGMNPILLQFIPEKIDKDSFIPIELAIQIISCADSEQAKLFQAIVSITVAREIDKMIESKYNEELKNLQGQINMKDRQLEEKDRITNDIHEYYREFNDTNHCFTSTEIAKDYGFTAQMFHQLLHAIGLIFPVNDTWQPYRDLAGYGYTTTKNENGKIGTYWTKDGRWFLHIALKRYGIEEGKDNTLAYKRIMNQ